MLLTRVSSSATCVYTYFLNKYHITIFTGIGGDLILLFVFKGLKGMDDIEDTEESESQLLQVHLS